MSITLSNEYLGLAQGPIEHESSSIVNAVCGDASLKIGDVVRLLPKGTGVGFTQDDDLLPRVGIVDSFGADSYGIVVGGDVEGVYSNGVINLDSNNLALGIIVAFFGESVRVCTQGRCLALADGTLTGSINVGDALTTSTVGLANALDDNKIMARALQSTAKANGIIAVDVKTEGNAPILGDLLFYNSIIPLTFSKAFMKSSFYHKHERVFRKIIRNLEGLARNGIPALTQNGIIDNRVLARSGLDGSNQVTLPTSNETSYIAVDSTSLYISDFGNSTVVKTNLDGTSAVTLPITDINPIGIAVDSTSIYVVSVNINKIVKADLDGTNQVTLPLVDLNNPIGIAVDSTSIYVVNAGSDAVIKADLDGTNQVTIPVNGFNNLNGIAVDSTSFYVVNVGGDAVIKADLDGSNQVSFPLTDVSGGFGIALDPTSYFVTNSIDETIKIAKTDLDGSNQTSLPVISGIDATLGIAMHNSTLTAFKKELTVLASEIASPLTDFPLLVSITDTNLRDNAKADGFDIFFTKADGSTVIPYDREFYDGSTGELVAWVLTDLSDTVDNKIFMFYGNPNSTDQQNPLLVWNTRFNDVYHFNESGLPYNNSSIGKNLSVLPSTGTPFTSLGQVDTSVAFDVANNETMETLTGSAVTIDDYFFSGWVKFDALGNGVNIFSTDFPILPPERGFFIRNRMDGLTTLFIDFINEAGITTSFPVGDISDLNFHHVAVRNNSTSFDMFFDGVFVATTSIINQIKFDIYRVGEVGIAGIGRLDELRVAHNSNFSNDFVKTSFDNQKTAGQGAGNFVKVGSQQPA